MTRSDVSQIDVLEAIVTRLQEVLVLNDRQCYPVARAQDVPGMPPGGDYWLTVAPGGGSFEPGEQVPAVPVSASGPGLPGNVTEDTTATVSIYTRVKLDSTGHDRFLLLDEARGLLSIKRLVLGALVGHDLLNPDGNPFLRNLLYAESCTAPDLVTIGEGSLPCGRLAITFGITFDWAI